VTARRGAVRRPAGWHRRFRAGAEPVGLSRFSNFTGDDPMFASRWPERRPPQ
jgi:hypothetical protein